MILVEGPNGGGKTTLVRHLAQTHGLQVADMKRELHRPPDTSPEAQKERVYTFLAGALKGNEPTKIVDRLYFSELVYGHAWRYSVAFSDDEQLLTEEVMRAMQIPVIFCMPAFETCLHNVEAQDNQHEKVLPTLETIYVMYQGLYTGRMDWITKFDYERDDVRDIDTKVQAYLSFKRERSW